MNELVFKAIGAAGILLISWGILKKDRFTGTLLYLSGGVCLEVYSLYIGDLIFIVLQAVFICVATYELFKLKSQKKRG